MPTALLQHPADPRSLFGPGQGQGQGQGQGPLRAQPSLAQDSPLPAQSPPRGALKALPERCAASAAPVTLLPDGDLSNDIDALNPSLTDFELQGNLWEELKDDSLAVDPLVLISSSPVPPQSFPSPCPLQGGGTPGTTIPMPGPAGAAPGAVPDPPLTTLYSAFLELDTVPPAYLSPPGSAPIALM
ncbi:hypothetical protein WISP_71262 [Willisornis vidua]|uniref:Uncharacterized protein n=1 Tax=Willisornis vidua TaxID=1566151 RepID=A0ABQ9D7E2_9PASS|nr:hypothetical protein WISP_71262 [Willisornis vidua]